MPTQGRPPARAMEPEELAQALVRHQLTNAAMAKLVVPPIQRSHVSELATGARTIGPVMAHRLRQAIAKLEGTERQG